MSATSPFIPGISLAFVLAVLPLCAGEDSGDSYEIEEIHLPQDMNPEISGVAFTPKGRLVVTNRHGDVWFTDHPNEGPWHRYAFGLHEPVGILAVSDREIYVTQRPELTRLLDTDGDGVADRYETVNDDWCMTDNWHEFTFGLHRDKKGNFLLAVGMPDMAGPFNPRFPRLPLSEIKVQREQKPSLGSYQGWVLSISPEGKMIPVASGFRQPAGIGISPEGEVFVTDQQGDYIATSTLAHIKPGGFYGYPASLKWREDYRGPIPDIETLAAMRIPESVSLPHGALGGSPGEPIWDTTGGKFGPFEGQVFVGDFTKLISRVFLEKVAGEYQGVAFPFIRDAVGLEAIQANSGANNLTIPAGKEGLKYFRDTPPRSGTPLRPGNMRMVFAPDGSLYSGQTTRGWGKGDGLQRIVWSGRDPVEIEAIRLTKDGFDISFTTEMDAAKLAAEETWNLSRFRYLYLPGGSYRVDETDCRITSIHPAADGRTVSLKIEALDPGYIYEFEPWELVSSTGKPVENPLAFYTLNRLLDGRRFEGPLTRALLKEKPSNGEINLTAGAQVYSAFCMICHQADGRGGALPGTEASAASGVVPLAAANFRQRGPDSPLAKSDEDLVRIVTHGPEGKPMPPFGGVLNQEQIRNVIAYLRSAFGKTEPSPEQESVK